MGNHRLDGNKTGGEEIMSDKITSPERDDSDNANNDIEKLREENARLKAEIDLLKAERAWRPMDTAPRDGTRVLAISSCGNYSSVRYSSLIRGWIVDENHDDIITSWMPLPDAPEVK
jgi:hypothetical protein